MYIYICINESVKRIRFNQLSIYYFSIVQNHFDMKSSKEPTKINQKRLVKMFKDIKRLDSSESKFCFLIGAGASKSSGIKTGWELSAEWYKELKEDLDEDELLQWEEKIDFNEEKVGEFYTHLYKKRYETSAQIGYDEFKKMMEHIEPDLGYVILSQILAYEKHNFVITTNFDYLIEDAVRMYTPTKPFSAGHETLAEFISSQTERPTIIKVHRDLFLHPFNDEKETEKLKAEWAKALTPILKDFNLLVIGYGGNDGSLMDYLQNISSIDRKSIYWCIRDEDEINSKIKDLLTEKDFIVKIDGFDELMFALNNALNYTVFENLDDTTNHPFILAARERIKSLNERRKNLLEKLQKDNKQIPNEMKVILSDSMQILLEASLEKDLIKKEKIYQKGLNTHPNDTDIIGDYAVFIEDELNDYDKAEELYRKAIELRPEDADFIGDYALFLENIRMDYDKSEELYKKAIGLDPKGANNIGNYAIFSKVVRKDYKKAEELYKKAIKLKPDEADFVGNYALFLYEIKKDYDNAEECFKKAIKLNPDAADFIGNFANFLKSIRKDYDKAEEFYKKAIELDPKNANIIGNYANFLKNIRENYDKAEKFYKKLIELDPNGANNIENYAIFLSDIRKDFDKAEEFYKKANELDPKNANKIGNYAHHLIISKQDFTIAENYIDRAFVLADKDNSDLHLELWFYRYAHYKKWYKASEKELGNLITIGAQSKGWNFQDHIKIAKENGHPNVAKLEEFAKAITK